MKWWKTYNITGIRTVFCLLLLLVGTQQSYAQLSSRVFRTKLLKDSLKANNNRDFLYNNVNIFNLSDKDIVVILEITPPDGWELTTQKITTVSLKGNENTIVNLRMIPSGSKTAVWETVQIEYRLNNGVEVLKDSFRVKVEEFIKFKASLPHSNYVLTSYTKNLSFPVKVKNAGNTTNEYFIKFTNNLLNLNYKQELTLPAGTDTTYLIPLRISDAQWGMLRNESIRVQVGQKGGDVINMAQTLSRVGSVLKQNSSAFLDMPLQLEVGTTYQPGGEESPTNIQYYGAVHGRVDFSEQDRVAFDYRSNTYTQGQVINNSIIRAEYTGAKWSATAGNVNELTDFIMDGYGAKVGYKWKGERNKIGVYGLLSSRTGNSKLFGANANIAISEKTMLTESATTNFDYDRNLNSYILKQGANIRFGDDDELFLTAGLGMEQATNKITNSDKQSQYGTVLGYKLNWSTKGLGILSEMLYNSNSYPGIFKGQRLQTHDVRANYKNFFAGGFYEYNFRAQNFYIDTAYFSDVFNLRTTNYGGRLGMSFKGGNLTLSSGKQIQLQSADTSYNPKYLFSYLNLTTSVSAFKKLFLTLSSYYGKGQLKGNEAATGVWVNSNQGSLQFDFVGVSGRYDNGPYFYHDYTKYLENPNEKYERIIISPYTQFNLFKKSLAIRSQFNYSKILPGNTETSSLLGNIVYNNYKKGFDLNVSGIIPINQKEAQPYVNASLRLRIHAPFVAVRRFYNLKLVLFKDVNANGKKDNGEDAIEGQTIAINNSMFVSDKDGIIIFKNITKGDYKADFGYSSKVKGWVPTGGTIQYYALTGKKTILVPFKKSKILYGKLKLIKDRNSNTDFKLGNLKVTAIGLDTATSYSTLTNAEGEFYFNLPAGKYTVTLNQAAFGDKYKPTQYAQQADLLNNDEKTIYFEIKEKRRKINIRRKKKK